MTSCNFPTMNFNQVLLRLIKPYVRIRLSYLSEELQIDQKEVVRLLVEIIHDRRPDLRIDQVNQTLVKVGSDQNILDTTRAQALMKLTEQLDHLTRSLVEKCI